MLILRVLPLCFATAWSADILAVFTVPSVSHQIVYRTLTLELNRRGHRLTVITPNPINDDNLKNYREIDVSFQYELWNREMVARPRDLGLLRNFPEIFILLFSKISPEFCHTYLSSPQVQSFLEEKNEFDLMITEFGINPCVYGFAKYSGYKYIGIYSFQTNAVSHANFGNPNTASYIPDVYFPHTDSMTFLQRGRNVLFQIFFWATYAYTMWSQNFIAKQYFGDDIPHLIDLERNVSALFVNSHFSTSYPRPNVPNLIEIGGPAFHLNNRKLASLPKVFVQYGVNVASGANILVIVPTPSYSHQQFYQVYLTELHNRGHNLTVATPNPLNNPNLTNYREIDLSYGYEYLGKALIEAFGPATPARMNPELYFIFASRVVDILCNKLLADENLMRLYRDNEKFNLVVLEWGINYCFLPFEKLSDGKVIGIASYEIGSLTHLAMGNPSNPAYVPDNSLDFSDRMTFWERVRTVLFYATAHCFTGYIRWKEYNIAKKYFGPDSESVYETVKKVALVLDNSNSAMTYPRPTAVNYIPLGGRAFHLTGRKLKKLPKDIQDFMDGAEHGVIYFSLGSNVKTIRGFEKEEKILIESFRRIKQRVLWKWENENIQIDLDNVRVSKWFPQVEILAHPNVKAFVTQGGLQSIGEAIEYRVPMIAIPFFADQGHNAMKMESVGIAITLDIGKLNTEEFTRALTDIVYDKKYKQKIIEYSKLVSDQPMHPLEKAIWWTEYVIRHDGAPHLRSIAATMPWYQYYMIDVLAAFSLLIFLFLYVVRLAFSKLFGMIFKKRNKSKKH